MTSLLPEIGVYKAMAFDYLAPKGYTLEDVKTGADAWNVAHYSGICTKAYLDDSVGDAHIKSLLSRIMPNAVFKDKYRY